VGLTAISKFAVEETTVTPVFAQVKPPSALLNKAMVAPLV
jgi:hypothetical protein